MQNGYIKLSRCLLYNAVFDNPDLLKVWLWCLLKASYKDHFQIVGTQKILLEDGEFVYGRKVAAAELKMSESKAYRLIKKLKTHGRVNIKPNNKYSIVSVINWGMYQNNNDESEQQSEQQNEQQMNNKRTTNEQQMNTNKKGNNGNKGKKGNIKNHYAEFVTLTEEEYQKLLEAHGQEAVKKIIEILDNYKGANGKKYNSDYRAILNWVIDRYKKENNPAPKKERFNDYAEFG